MLQQGWILKATRGKSYAITPKMPPESLPRHHRNWGNRLTVGLQDIVSLDKNKVQTTHIPNTYDYYDHILIRIEFNNSLKIEA